MIQGWRMDLLTEIGRIVIAGTVHVHLGQEGYNAKSETLIDALALGQQIEPIELLEQSSAGLMDGADDGPSSLCQLFQQRDALHARRTVQSTKSQFNGYNVKTRTLRNAKNY